MTAAALPEPDRAVCTWTASLDADPFKADGAAVTAAAVHTARATPDKAIMRVFMVFMRPASVPAAIAKNRQ